MGSDPKLTRLVEVLRELGAPEPEGWAASEFAEGIPQTARFLFLRQAWRCVVADGSSWIETTIAHATRKPDDPYAGAGHALARLRARGATDRELTELVRAMQAELLFSFCYLLEDPGEVEPAVADLSWGLFLTDEEGNPLEHLGGLHESVLETDPAGREVRPPADWQK